MGRLVDQRTNESLVSQSDYRMFSIGAGNYHRPTRQGISRKGDGWIVGQPAISRRDSATVACIDIDEGTGTARIANLIGRDIDREYQCATGGQLRMRDYAGIRNREIEVPSSLAGGHCIRRPRIVSVCRCTLILADECTIAPVDWTIVAIVSTDVRQNGIGNRRVINDAVHGLRLGCEAIDRIVPGNIRVTKIETGADINKVFVE